jgi:uncharacterized protein YqeY
MNTIEKLKVTTLQLRKDRHSLGPTMQFHLSELANIGKAKNRETTEDEAIQYLKKSAQKLKEDEHSNLQEADILEQLLPQMVSADEVRAHIFMLEAEQGLDISNKGAVMKAVKAEFGALVDMKMVQGML